MPMATNISQFVSSKRGSAASSNIAREVKDSAGNEFIQPSSYRLAGHHDADLLVKRAFDVVIATMCLLIFLPVLIVTSFAIWFEDRGPIFFRQTRIGASGVPFNMLKFRSMCVDAEKQREASEKQVHIYDLGTIS